MTLATSSVWLFPISSSPNSTSWPPSRADPIPSSASTSTCAPDNHGRDSFEPFLRKELGERLARVPRRGARTTRASEHDAGKIRAYVNEVDPSVNGLGDLPRARAPTSSRRSCFRLQSMSIGCSSPINLTSTPWRGFSKAVPVSPCSLPTRTSARLFVVAGNAVQQTEHVEGVRTRRHKMGGWAQARYQRHIENLPPASRERSRRNTRTRRARGRHRLHHHRRQRRDRAIAEGTHSPRMSPSRIVDVHRSSTHTRPSAISWTRPSRRCACGMRRRIESGWRRCSGPHRANGLGCVGVEETRLALERGQVDELVIATVPEMLDTDAGHDRPRHDRGRATLGRRA